MDNEVPSKKVSPEEARESLIAISETLPEKPSTLPAEDIPMVSRNGVVGHEKEGYISQLISIADTPSPDTKGTSAK